MSTYPHDETLQARHDKLIGRLAQQVDNPELDEGRRELAQSWRQLLEITRERATSRLSMAFMAKVGCGKSTLIAAATGLRLEGVGENPKRWSVLPVDDGRTTLGDTCIEFDERENILLEVDPVPASTLSTELRLFANDHWRAYRNGEKSSLGYGGEELHGLLRRWLLPDSPNPRVVLKELVDEAPDVEAFHDDLRSRIDFDVRTKPFQRTYADDDNGLLQLKGDLKAIMRGELADAPAPLTIRLSLPAENLGDELRRIIDTQGIDSDAPEVSIRARRDLQEHFLDPDTLLVICSEFESAPDVVSRQLIAKITDDKPRREKAWRLLIVHKRDPDAEPGEREEESRLRDERVAQCQDQLRRAELPAPETQIFAFDARSESGELRRFITTFVEEERQRRCNVWAQTLAEASEAIEAFADVEFAAQAREWDLRLWWVWDVEFTRVTEEWAGRSWKVEEAGLLGVAKGVRLMVPRDHHWSHLHAAVRRRGGYARLDLAMFGGGFAAIDPIMAEVRASRKVMSFVSEASKWVNSRLADHINLRAKQFNTAVISYFEQVHSRWQKALRDYFESSASDDLWQWCEQRWGKGSGYVDDVAACFEREATRVKIVPSSPSDPRTIYDALPLRPSLLALQRIELQNFRCVDQRAIRLARDITVLVGDNGLGKTCWLEAIAAGVGALLPEMDTAEPVPPLDDGDVRSVTRIIHGILDPQPQLPMRIELSVTLQGHQLEWLRRRESMTATVVSEGEGMQVIARRIAEEVRAHDERQLPILAYYGTQRLWPPDLRASDNRRELGNRFEGYRACLEPASTHIHMLEWIRHYTMAGLQRRKSYPQVRAVEKAVVECVEGAVGFEYSLERQDFVLHMQDGEVRLFRQLSDGYRNIVAMVADVAWRAVRLNPQLGARAPELAEGIVLIDEIDLHLHPKWQRHVLEDLHRAFPRLQFITTTHSPFIIHSLREGQLINLDPGATSYDYTRASPEDITEHIMGVEVPQRSYRRKREAEVAMRYYELLDRVPEANPQELAALERELDELTAPYADNQAFVALLRRELLSAKAQRPL